RRWAYRSASAAIVGSTPSPPPSMWPSSKTSDSPATQNRPRTSAVPARNTSGSPHSTKALISSSGSASTSSGVRPSSVICRRTIVCPPGTRVPCFRGLAGAWGAPSSFGGRESMSPPVRLGGLLMLSRPGRFGRRTTPRSGPRKHGTRALLLDRNHRHLHVPGRLAAADHLHPGVVDVVEAPFRLDPDLDGVGVSLLDGGGVVLDLERDRELLEVLDHLLADLLGGSVLQADVLERHTGDGACLELPSPLELDGSGDPGLLRLVVLLRQGALPFTPNHGDRPR